MTKYTLRKSQKLKTLQRGSIIVAGISFASVCGYLLFTMNTTKTDESNAFTNSDLLKTDPIGNGEIVSAFSWDNFYPSIADVGPLVKKMSPNAECVYGGKDLTMGLSAGNTGRDINMELPPASFNMDGIDISVDFRCYETSGSFASRGTYFDFGFTENKLTIQYKLKTEAGKFVSVKEITRFDMPKDTLFRNYRFIYNAMSSKAEIFVDNVPVWANQASDGAVLCWEKNDELVIGKGLNGEATAKAILDNLIIRKTNRARTMPLTLLSFTAEAQGNKVMLNWFTAKEDGVDYFKIERSNDTRLYEEVGRVKAAGHSNELKAYALMDTQPTYGVSYYRLSLPNTDVKSVWVPVIALRIMPGSILSSPNENSSLNQRNQ